MLCIIINSCTCSKHLWALLPCTPLLHQCLSLQESPPSATAASGTCSPSPQEPPVSPVPIILTTQLCFVTFCHVLFKIYPVFTNTVANCKFFKKIYKNFFNESISTVECGFIYKLQPTINLLYSSEMYSGIGTVPVVATLGTLFSL